MWKAGFLFAMSLLSVAITTALVICVVPSAFSKTGSSPKLCSPKYFRNDSFVCVCNSSYCDEVEGFYPFENDLMITYTSSKSGLRLVKSGIQFASKQPTTTMYVTVNRTALYQEIKGFGGAFTDASGVNIASLSAQTQNKLLQSYFSSAGIEYNIGRIPMAGCDFSTRGYTYDDYPGDFVLTNFSLQMEDHVYKIPFIKEAIQMNNRPMSFFGSPWSAPAWLKTNNDLIGKGSIIGNPGGEYFKTWALYFAKFIEEYEKQNIPIWGITAQNEPTDGKIERFPFNCMGFTPEQQRDFIKLDLGPTLHDHNHSDVKLMIMDDQRVLLSHWPQVVLGDPETEHFVDGIAVHWYMDFVVPAELLRKTHEQFPSKFVLATEACNGAFPWNENNKVDLGSWERGENYSEDIIQDIANWVTGWVDWNLALDMTGGPNWKKNFVDSPIIVNKERDEFYKQPMFYHLGHFSKFIPEGSIKIESIFHEIPPSVKHVAFMNKEKKFITLVLLNKSSSDFLFSVVDPEVGAAKDVLFAQSIKTFIWSTA